MRQKLFYVSLGFLFLVFLACIGKPGIYEGNGWIPSAEAPAECEARFGFVLIAQDKEPDDNGQADTFRGHMWYRDEAAGVDILGTVVDAVDEEIVSPEEYDELGGVYGFGVGDLPWPYNETTGQYGAFGGFWTAQRDSSIDGVTEGVFVIYAVDDEYVETEEEVGDGLRLELFELGADIFDPDQIIYACEGPITRGHIKLIPDKH